MTKVHRIVLAVATIPFSTFVAGCAADLSPSAPPMVKLRGSVHGGQQPITGSSIQLYAANTATAAGPSSPLLKVPVFSDLNGNFTITNDYNCPTVTSTPVYLVAVAGNPGLALGTNNTAIILMAALGPCSGLSANTFIDVTEVTTVAAAYGLGASMSDAAHVGASSLAAITASFTLAAELATTSYGTSPGGALPAGSYAPSAKLNTLADILAVCVNSDGSGATGNTTPCGQLFTDTVSSGAMPSNTLAAAINVAANPTSGVAALFSLAGSSPPFQPVLTVSPTDWTMTIASLTWASPAGMTATVPLGANQLNATATVPGTFAYSPAAGTVLSVGTHPLAVTFTPADAADYPAIPASVNVAVNNPSYSWNGVRIVGGGYVTGIVAHPNAANVRYARTDVGGAYSWNQASGSWVAITDFYNRSNSSYGGCESIALDPSDPQRLYLGVGEYSESFGGNGAFLLSDDQGATFTSVAAPFKMGSNDNGRSAGERFAVDPNLGTILYYGSRLSGLWMSTNRGLNWSKVTSFPVTGTTGASGAGAGIVFVDFVASSGSSGSATPVIYVGVSDTGTSGTGYSSLYVSINGGSTWAAVPGQPTGYYPIRGVIGPDAAGPNDILYLSYSNGIGPGGITAGALWKYVLPPATNPGGTGTWTNINPGTNARQSGSQGGFNGIAVDLNNPGVVMASTIDDYYPGDDIYRSINYGATWNSLVVKQGATHNTSLSPWLLFGGSSAGTGTWPGGMVIDPFNSNHLMYGTGQTLWDSTNINVSDTGGAATFNVGALGIEETVVQALSSPPSGPALYSGTDDLGGFVHTSVTTSPASGMIENPRLGQISSIDFAQNLSANVAFVGYDGNTAPFGAYSTNSGTSWTPFAAQAPGTTAGAGVIAVSADGSTMVWAPSDAAVAYSTNHGAAWTASTGATMKSGVVADRINGKKFYIFSSGSSTGTLQISLDGGHTFANTATGLPNYSVLVASYVAEGDLWLGSSSSGLYRSTNSGTSFSAVPGFSYVYGVSLGAAAPGASYPAIYVIGQSSGGSYGFFRSVDQGVTWTQINDVNHQWGYVEFVSGDPKTFGRIYLSSGGRGIIYGDSPY